MNSSSIRHMQGVQGLLKKRLDQSNRRTACGNQLPCILQHSMALSSVLHLLTPTAAAEYNSASTSSGKCAQLNCLHTQLLLYDHFLAPRSDYCYTVTFALAQIIILSVTCEMLFLCINELIHKVIVNSNLEVFSLAER